MGRVNVVALAVLAVAGGVAPPVLLAARAMRGWTAGAGVDELAYQLVRRGLRRQGAVRLLVPAWMADPPGLVLVASADGYRPIWPTDGTELVRIPPGVVDGRPFAFDRPPDGYLRGFLVGPGADHLRLRDPSCLELRPRRSR